MEWGRSQRRRRGYVQGRRLGCGGRPDERRLDDNLDGDGNSNWEVEFDFRDADTPTWTGTVLTVNVPTASIPGSGTYLTVSVAVPPALAAGDYVMVVLAEDEAGNMVEIARTVALTIS